MLERLRSWLAGLFGGDDGDDGDDGNHAADPAEAGSDRDTAEPSGLNPDNVTEVRTEADEDPVEKLRDIERERERPDGPGSKGDG